MPIYEFYCDKCHVIYNFFSRRINTDKRPDCPKCGRPKLERRVSRFAIGRGGSSESKSGDNAEADDDLLPPGFDEEKFEEAMMELATEAENLDEDDPRQMARLMRRLSQKTGLQFGSAMEEAIRRLEAGEDPETIEEELGDVLEQEEPLFQQSGKSLRTLYEHLKPPRVDEKLYDLD
ncbi:MAG: zinc ribbon domain-containing protein [Thermogutta sp.]|nr:zinc ribbon domain-containing protein [Thermogutta sp.]HPU06522.1 zinc ribbon domain-containing protein [Thermogutta sp.]HPZ82716.1 zinc ribbon domain-containing protein [Thermogutta sp.]HQF12510.1 zinc ribbon domain-containing protein [Thermogutta sp.]